MNMMALGGFSEVIRLFDVRKKKDLGELAGEHSGSITCLQFYKNKFLISASEDSSIIIWRCKDWVSLHKLVIKNKSKVINMSLHHSGKMLLALYENGVLRLWNMMEARCNYKKKMGVLDEVVEEEGAEVKEDSDQDLEITEITKKDLNDHERKPIVVKWEPSAGVMYTVLYTRMIEIYDPSNKETGDKPCASAIFDSNVVSFDYISANSLVVTDTEGNLIVIKNIENDEKLDLHIFRTKFTKIREVKTSYNRQLNQFEYISGVTLDRKVPIWYCSTICDFDEDLEELKPNKVIKSKWRLTCLAINNLKDFKPHSKKKKVKIV
jgi:WD40 repeat protein